MRLNDTPNVVVDTKQGQTEATCLFNYPKPTQPSTELHFEQMPNGYVGTTLDKA